MTLVDSHGRTVDYARISVTDRCNYRCLYCMPESGVEWIPHSRIISYEEILFLISWMFGAGIRKVRFTGGEPLVRKGLIPFLREVNALVPGMKIALTTNGALLARYAEELRDVKLAGINVSLDTLDERKFSEVTRGGRLADVLDGISAVRELGVRVKMNAVLMKGFNDGEIADMLDFASAEGILLRLIEFMPLDGDVWSGDRFISSFEVLNRISPDGWAAQETENPLSLPLGPARYFVNKRTGQRIGVISAVTSHYCGSCNRLRVDSGGLLRPCLFSNFSLDLRAALLAKDSAKLYDIFSSALAIKAQIGVEQGATEPRHMFPIGG